MDIKEKLEQLEEVLLDSTGCLRFVESDYYTEKEGVNWINPGYSLEEFLDKFIITRDLMSYFTFGKDGFQCRPNKRRSFDDIFCVAKNYYPDVKLIDIYRYIIQKDTDDKIKWINCPDIQKRVVHSTNVNSILVNRRNEETYQEHGITEEELKSLL